MMAWSDCRPTSLQLASYTHRHSHTQALATLSATTQLATVCVLPSSLLQASRSALRQGKPTHTLSRTHTHSHRHTPRCSTPRFFFGREEMRREQRQGGVALFASSHSCRAAVKSGRPQISQGFRCSVLKVVSKRFGAPSLKRGNMQQIGEPEPGETHKILGSRKRDLDLCGGFWKRANFFFLFFVLFLHGKTKAGATPEVLRCSSSKTLLQLLTPWALTVSADSPPACQPARWHSTPAALVPGYRRGRA